MALPGGRIHKGESIEQATKRIMKDKHQIDAKLTKTHSVSLEHIGRKYSFILLLVSATTEDQIELSNIQKSKSKMIQSDYKVITTQLEKEIEIPTITSRA
jgi:ADP-ribose pyrophosphatase YjhB (NUDIX family)